MAITRGAHERQETYQQQVERFQEQARQTRAEQERCNQLALQSRQTAKDRAREVLGRLRRTKAEIDPLGRL